MCRFLFHQLIVHEVGGGNCCVKVAVGKTGKYSDGGKIVVVYIAGPCGGRTLLEKPMGTFTVSVPVSFSQDVSVHAERIIKKEYLS